MYGYEQYLSIERKYSNVEIEEKQKIVEFLKKSSSSFKNANYKVTKVMIQEIMSDLLTNNQTQLSVLIAFSIFYQKRIIIVKTDPVEKYVEFYPISLENTTDKNKIILLNINKKKEYGVDLDVTEEKIKHIENTMFKMEHYEKSLKSMIHYKVDELENIADYFHIDLTKKMKKMELYQEVAKISVW